MEQMTYEERKKKAEQIIYNIVADFEGFFMVNDVPYEVKLGRRVECDRFLEGCTEEYYPDVLIGELGDEDIAVKKVPIFVLDVSCDKHDDCIASHEEYLRCRNYLNMGVQEYWLINVVDDEILKVYKGDSHNGVYSLPARIPVGITENELEIDIEMEFQEIKPQNNIISFEKRSIMHGRI